jgi:hypothetical protein
MPTYERSTHFRAQWARLTPAQKSAFQAARRRLVACLRSGTFDHRLRVKRVRGRVDVWELAWAYDGRALFSYGPSKRNGEPHVIWLAIGTHKILDES